MPTPLIPIKHPDGTIEKVTLDEFKARQKKATVPKSAVPAPVKPSEPAIKKPELTKITPKPIEKKIEKSTPTPPPAKPDPVKEKKPITSMPQAAKTEEGKSLLEEELPLAKQSTPMASADRREEAETIVKKLNLQISEEAKKRLIGLVQLRLKDVRGETEVKEWLTKAENEMGIGLSEEKAESVLSAVREILKQPRKDDMPIIPLKRPLGTPSNIPATPTSTVFGATKALAKEEREPLPAVNTPVNSFIHPERVSINSSSNKMPKSLDELVKKESAAFEPSIESLMPNKGQPARTIVRDISTAKPTHLGPVEELRYITLTDFRRLSTNPEEAAARLRQKFFNLKDESYILYMNGLTAWRQSPLFTDYTNAAISALNSKIKMTDESMDKEKIQIPEIQALVVMQKQLV